MTSQLKDVHFANIGVCSGVDGGMRMIDSAEYLSLPQGCRTLSVCEGATIAFDDGKGESAGFQFIPEAHDVEASEIIGNFLWNVLHLEPNYNCESFIEQTVRDLRAAVGDGQAVCVLSGGVDSTTAACLARRAVGDRLHCLVIDKGLEPDGEVERIRSLIGEGLGLEIRQINAAGRMMDQLQGCVTPESKRKAVAQFISDRIADEAARLGGRVTVIRATNYPDVLEGHASSALPGDIPFAEPLRELFKDEVRAVAAALSVPEEICQRQHYPSAGIALRCMGAVNAQKLSILRAADAILQETVAEKAQYAGLRRADGLCRSLPKRCAPLCAGAARGHGHERRAPPCAAPAAGRGGTRGSQNAVRSAQRLSRPLRFVAHSAGAGGVGIIEKACPAKVCRALFVLRGSGICGIIKRVSAKEGGRMAEFYAHERVAKRAAELIESTAAERPAAFLTGAEGPDPMFFHGFWRCKARGFSFRKLGLHLHAVRCPEFLWELIAGAETSVQKAYTLGFFTHYALDQILHPYIYDQCRKGQNFGYTGGHGVLEQAIDATLYLKDTGARWGMEPPMKDFGVFLIDKQEEKEIDELLCGAVYRAYAPLRVARGQFREAFRHLRLGKRFISHPTSFKRKLWRGLEKTLHMKNLLTSRCAPTVLPTCDYMNLSHREWRDAQAPDVPRRDSVYELLDRAERRAAEYMDCVQGVWDGTRTKAELFALMKNRSYNSDAPNSSRDGRA